jgi:hypothetical protein
VTRTLAFLFVGFGLVAILIAPPTFALAAGLAASVTPPVVFFATVSLTVLAVLWWLL